MSKDMIDSRGHGTDQEKKLCMISNHGEIMNDGTASAHHADAHVIHISPSIHDGRNLPSKMHGGIQYSKLVDAELAAPVNGEHRPGVTTDHDSESHDTQPLLGEEAKREEDNYQKEDSKKMNAGSHPPPLYAASKTAQPPFLILEPIKKERLLSLDVFRGMTVVAMILVDYGGGLWSGINHSPWDSITFADYVVPAFLFIVGVSLALAYKSLDNMKSALSMISLRFLKLFGLGLLLQGGFLHGVRDLSYGVNLQTLRITGILQRIAFAYAIVALLEMCTSKKYIPDASESFFGIVKIYYLQWVAAFVIVAVYLGLIYGLYVPNWQFEAPSSFDFGTLPTNSSLILSVQCNVRGSLTPGCNAVGYVDRSILGLAHLYQRPPYRRTKECSLNSPYGGPLPADAPAWCLAAFDPEGLLSSLPAVLTCLIGTHYGHVLLHVKGHKKQLWQWTSSGLVLLLAGLLLNFAGMPLNKQLYTLSYTLVTGGAVALAFAAVFVLVDIFKWRSSTAIFKFIGAHSLMVYALFACDVLPIALHGIYWKSSENNLIHFILKTFGFGHG